MLHFQYENSSRNQNIDVALDKYIAQLFLKYMNKFISKTWKKKAFYLLMNTT